MALQSRILFLFTYNNYEFLADEPDEDILNRLNTKLFQNIPIKH